MRDKVASGKDMGNEQGKRHKAKHKNDSGKDKCVAETYLSEGLKDQ